MTVHPFDATSINDGIFQGWGTSLCWWANRIGYSDDLSEEASKDFFNKEEGLGLNIMRYNIGGGDDPTHDHITRTDSKMPGYATNYTYDEDSGEYTWDYDWTQDENQRNVLNDAIEEAGTEAIVEAFSNSPPYFMTNSGCTSGALDSSDNNLKDDAYEEFATYLADIAEHFDTEWGIHFQSMSPMNEPASDYWGAYSTKQEGCHFDRGDSQSEILVDLRNALDDNDLSDILVSGTDETSIDTQIESYGELSDSAKSILDRIDTHTYSGSSRTALSSLAETEGKNLWMSEVDGGSTAGEDAGEMGAGLWLANRIVTDINGLNPSAWILWQAIDSHISEEGYEGNEDTGMVDLDGGYWGIAVADHDNVQIIKTMKYYSFGQFTRYIRPGYILLSGTDNTVMAYDPDGKQVVIVAVNDTDSDESYCFDLSHFQSVGTSVAAIRTSGSIDSGEKWASLDSLTTSSKTFTASLKANSVTTYIVSDVERGSLGEKIDVQASQVSGSTPWKNGSDVASNVVDQDASTFFDGVADGYVTIDLGQEYTIDRIGYAPRTSYEYRCVDASFYGSTDGEDWTELYTISEVPEDGVSNWVYDDEMTSSSPFRYIKYSVPSGEPTNSYNSDDVYNCNIAEIEVYGH